MRIVTGVGDLVQGIGDGQTQVGYSVAGRSRGWLMLCAVCTMHEDTRSTNFLVWPQNQWQQFLLVWPQNGGFMFPGLGLKTGIYGLVILASKLQRWFIGVGLNTKLATVCRLHHKTNGRLKMTRDTR
jgi:hypothetical protein